MAVASTFQLRQGTGAILQEYTATGIVTVTVSYQGVCNSVKSLFVLYHKEILVDLESCYLYLLTLEGLCKTLCAYAGRTQVLRLLGANCTQKFSFTTRSSGAHITTTCPLVYKNQSDSNREKGQKTKSMRVGQTHNVR